MFKWFRDLFSENKSKDIPVEETKISNLPAPPVIEELKPEPDIVTTSYQVPESATITSIPLVVQEVKLESTAEQPLKHKSKTTKRTIPTPPSRGRPKKNG